MSLIFHYFRLENVLKVILLFLSFSAGNSFKSVEDGNEVEGEDGVGGGANVKDNENGSIEKDSPTTAPANAETPTKSSKLSIFGSKDKKDKADKNDKDKDSKMPLGLGGKPKGATSSDGFDGKC